MKQMQQKRLFIMLMVLVLALGGAFSVYYFAKPNYVGTGNKQITFEVIVDGKVQNSYPIKTNEEFLRKALEQTEGLEIKGSESTYGLFVTEINGRAADDSKQEWWKFTKSGEMLNTGVDSTPITDGDKFEATLATGY